MAQFDVYVLHRTDDLFLELQSSNVGQLPTRIGAPLVLRNIFYKPVEKLHPEFWIADQPYVMLSHHLFSVPLSDLRRRVGNLTSA